MSKKIKNLMTVELTKRVGEIDSVAVISPKGIDGAKTHGIRRRLHEKGLRMTVVKNTLVRRALTGKKIEGFHSLLDGPSALIYGQASISAIARLLLDEKKNNEKIELRGAFFDGEVYTGDKGMETVSKLPTREEAIGSLIATILGPGAGLAGALAGPGSTLGSLLTAIEDKAKESEPK
jgi:large subunit ribosomal protein L10